MLGGRGGGLRAHMRTVTIQIDHVYLAVACDV